MRRWPWLCTLSLVACATPDPSRERSAVAGLQRVLALDLSPAAASRRAVSLDRAGARLVADVWHWRPLATPAAWWRREVDGTHAAIDGAAGLAAAELARRPGLPEPLRPDARAIGQDLADAPFTAGALLLPARALPEIDDRRHRTDPADDRAEASWWQRLRRRLWL